MTANFRSDLLLLFHIASFGNTIDQPPVLLGEAGSGEDFQGITVKSLHCQPFVHNSYGLFEEDLLTQIIDLLKFYGPDVVRRTPDDKNLGSNETVPAGPEMMNVSMELEDIRFITPLQTAEVTLTLSEKWFEPWLRVFQEKLPFCDRRPHILFSLQSATKLPFFARFGEFENNFVNAMSARVGMSPHSLGFVRFTQNSSIVERFTKMTVDIPCSTVWHRRLKQTVCHLRYGNWLVDPDLIEFRWNQTLPVTFRSSLKIRYPSLMLRTFDTLSEYPFGARQELELEFSQSDY